MSFSKDVILSLAILGVVMESDLGRRRVGWFRVARPVIVAVGIIPIFFTTLPTSGNDLVLQGSGALLGLCLGVISVSPLFVAFSVEPAHRSWWAKQRGRPGRPAAITYSGTGYALIWAAATAARLGFAWSSGHLFPHALGVFLHRHQLSSVALTNALIFLPLGMELFRSAGLVVRASNALHRDVVTPQFSQAR